MSLEQDTASRSAKILRCDRSTWPTSSQAAKPPTNYRDVSIRVLDLLLTTLGLLISLPLFLVIAIAIRLDSRGPVLFIQKRVGRGGRPFPCYKFRSMRTDAEVQRQKLLDKNERTGPVFKMREDPRVTRVGRLLRKSSLDELPQLLNVFLGHMSLVGPRPAIPSEVEQYTPQQLERLTILPGLTGLWQVSGRASLSFEAMIELDLIYAGQRSVWTNIRILAMTIPAVISGRGAY